MRYRRTDYDWSDYHQGLSPERTARYQAVLKAITDGLEGILKERNEGYDIVAMVPEGIFATGTRGDRRVYTPIVTLTYSVIPPYDHMEQISNAISNRLPVCRVVLNMTHRVISVPGLGVQFIVHQSEHDKTIAHLTRWGHSHSRPE